MSGINTRRLIGLHISLLLLFASSMAAQVVSGTWHGHISTMGSTLPLVFDIQYENGLPVSSLKSPKQTNQTIAVETTEVRADSIFMDISAIGGSYQGAIVTDSIVGTFSQMGNSTPLTLHRGGYTGEEIVKAQDPIGPFPYVVEDFVFVNSYNLGSKLAGTLTLPSEVQNPPAVVLISGSGAQDRNEEILGHKPFWVLADHLSRRGVAVLRFDDRGVGGSEGDHSIATSFDFATDVTAAIDYLRSRVELQHSHIGLIGHSEGALIASIVVTEQPDRVDFFVSLAGPGVSGKEVLVSQTVAGLRVAGAYKEVVAFDSMLVASLCDAVLESKSETLPEQLQKVLDTQLEYAEGYSKTKYNRQMQEAVINQYASPWMRAFIAFDPLPYLTKVTCPTLLLNGAKDIQVLPHLNLSAMEAALLKAGNSDVTAIKIEGLNHLFQTAKTGSTFEYGRLEETFSPTALEIISDWIFERF